MNNNRPRALIVDDEADIRELVEITLGRMGVETESAGDLAQSRILLAEQNFDLCLTDMRLPDGDGIELVTEIGASCPVAVITAYGNTEAAVASLKAGAFDFVSKPLDVNVLRRLVDQALRLSAEPSKHISKSTPEAGESPRLLGETPAMEKLRATIAKLARSQAPVYITGESGTGKELTARSIHTQGARSAKDFVPVNCGAIPSELMESEFFGHVKGAFTGATRDKKGLFASADGGTLFLDEIAELPLHMQVKLLRAIQERAVRAVGTETEIPVDVRIISATHKDLAQQVANGQFREDLYYRINVIEVRVPPLRERSDDIPTLANRILAALARQMGLDTAPQLSKAALEALKNHDFPGNVRELENILERAVTLCDQTEITPDYLRLQTTLSRPSANASQSNLATDTAPEAANTGSNPRKNTDENLDENLEDIERQKIMQALESTRFNKTKAAQTLGISFRALRYRLKKLGID